MLENVHVDIGYKEGKLVKMVEELKSKFCPNFCPLKEPPTRGRIQTLKIVILFCGETMSLRENVTPQWDGSAKIIYENKVWENAR